MLFFLYITKNVFQAEASFLSHNSDKFSVAVFSGLLYNRYGLRGLCQIHFQFLIRKGDGIASNFEFCWLRQFGT